MTEMPPPGWYPDPSNDQQLRWWTGERWTGAARPLEPAEPPSSAEELIRSVASPHEAESAGAGQQQDPEATQAMPVATAAEPPELVHVAQGTVETGGWSGSEQTYEDAGPEDGWPKERKVAAGALGALLLVPLLVWIVAMVGQGRDDDRVAVDDEPTVDEPASDDDAGGAADDAGADGEATEGAGEAEAADDAVTAGERVVDFDGRCRVEIDQIPDDAVLRPWQFDECDRAPIDLDAGEDRWIVVIASIDGENPEDVALDRADGYDLLWSSHYPSLNPGWWVIFDGPFSAEEAALEAAEAAGGGAYPRLLTDDEGDRYCIADDGC